MHLVLHVFLVTYWKNSSEGVCGLTGRVEEFDCIISIFQQSGVFHRRLKQFIHGR
jgi:hypothetical protein